MVTFASQTQSTYEDCQGEERDLGITGVTVSTQEWYSLWMLVALNGYPDLARYWTLSWKKCTVSKVNTLDCCYLEIFGIWGLFLSPKGGILFLVLVIPSTCFRLFVNIVLKSWKEVISVLIWNQNNALQQWQQHELESVLQILFRLNDLCAGSPRFSENKLKCFYIYAKPMNFEPLQKIPWTSFNRIPCSLFFFCLLLENRTNREFSSCT